MFSENKSSEHKAWINDTLLFQGKDRGSGALPLEGVCLMPWLQALQKTNPSTRWALPLLSPHLPAHRSDSGRRCSKVGGSWVFQH